MKRLFLLCTCLFASCAVLLAGEVESSAIHKIVAAELLAMKLPANSSFCLAILPARNISETGADPSPQVLRFLAGRGMRPRKASLCYKPPSKGNVISVEVLKEAGDRLSAKVAFSDVTIIPGRDLGVLRRRGVYELTKGKKGRWAIRSYQGEANDNSR
jgi:hypothetical protein